MIDVNGAPLRQNDVERLVILKTENEGETWHPLEYKDVPDWVKHPDTIAFMRDGEYVQKDGEAVWYMAVRPH